MVREFPRILRVIANQILEERHQVTPFAFLTRLLPFGRIQFEVGLTLECGLRLAL